MVCGAMMACGLWLAAAPVHAALPEPLAARERAHDWSGLLREADHILAGASLSLADMADVQEARARALLEAQRPEEALAAAGVALDAVPDHTQALVARGMAHLALGHGQEAEDDFLKATRAPDMPWQAMAGLGALERGRGRVDLALAWYAKAVQANANDVDLRLEQAMLLWEAGHGGDALAALDQLQQLAPQRADIFNDRGMMRLRMGDAEGALRDFDLALKVSPNLPEALLNRGNLLRGRGALDKAMADYDTALAQDPGHTRLLVARSYAWMAQGRYDKARMDLGAALAVGSLDAYVLNELAWFLATCPEAGYRDGKRAVSLASEAIELSLIPSPGHYDTLAAALAEAGRYEDAAEAEAVALQSAAGGPSGMVQAWQERLALYRANRPYHQQMPARK